MHAVIELALLAAAISASGPAHSPARPGFESVVLVSNHRGVGANFDPDLVNAWAFPVRRTVRCAVTFSAGPNDVGQIRPTNP